MNKIKIFKSENFSSYDGLDIIIKFLKEHDAHIEEYLIEKEYHKEIFNQENISFFPTINFYDTDNNLYYSVTEKHRPEKLLLIYNGPRIVYVYAKKDTPLYKNFQSWKNEFLLKKINYLLVDDTDRHTMVPESLGVNFDKNPEIISFIHGSTMYQIHAGNLSKEEFLEIYYKQVDL